MLIIRKCLLSLLLILIASNSSLASEREQVEECINQKLNIYSEPIESFEATHDLLAGQCYYEIDRSIDRFDLAADYTQRALKLEINHKEHRTYLTILIQLGNILRQRARGADQITAYKLYDEAAQLAENNYRQYYFESKINKAGMVCGALSSRDNNISIGLKFFIRMENIDVSKLCFEEPLSLAKEAESLKSIRPCLHYFA